MSSKLKTFQSPMDILGRIISSLEEKYALYMKIYSISNADLPPSRRRWCVESSTPFPLFETTVLPTTTHLLLHLTKHIQMHSPFAADKSQFS